MMSAPATLKLIGEMGRDDLATVFILENSRGKRLECVESLQPPLPRSEKWVLIISTLFGCPIGCRICDAGSTYSGKIPYDELLGQVDFLIGRRFPERTVGVKKFKIQFARMGEPLLNPAVFDLLESLPRLYEAPGLMPSFSTIAPRGCLRGLSRLKEIKDAWYGSGRFQLQFSIHSTDPAQRDEIIPAPKLSLRQISAFGGEFRESGDRLVTLNFALARGMHFDPAVMIDTFDPAHFLVKLTPVNPTFQAVRSSYRTVLGTEETSIRTAGPAWSPPFEAGCPPTRDDRIIDTAGKALDDLDHAVRHLKESGFEVLISVGELEENRIGSNCGQYVAAYEEMLSSSGWKRDVFPFLQRSYNPDNYR